MEIQSHIVILTDSHDRKLLIRAIDNVYKKSNNWVKKKSKELQRRQFSEKYVNTFFARS